MINHHCLIFPHFSAVSCGNPGTPAHGRIVFSDGITFGSSVAYACWEGFKTSGLTTRHCTTNGTWTGQPPDCTGRLQAQYNCFIVTIMVIISRRCGHFYASLAFISYNTTSTAADSLNVVACIVVFLTLGDV